MVDEQSGILVAQRDVDGLARAIGWLAADAGARQAMGAAARRAAVAAFDYRVMARTLMRAIAAEPDVATMDAPVAMPEPVLAMAG